VIRLCPQLWLAGGLALVGSNLPGETPVFLVPAASAVGEKPDAAKKETPGSSPLSPHLKAALRTGLPVYIPTQPAALENLAQFSPKKTMASDDPIVSLPSYVVRDTRPPPTEDLLSPEGKLTRYLGPEDGFDRRWLNRVVLHWDLGPVAVSLFGAMKNDTRAEMLRRDTLRLENREELLDWSDLLKRTGNVEAGKWVT
jgi:hypothetical protein